MPKPAKKAASADSDFNISPLSRKRCEEYTRALQKALGPITPVAARPPLVGAAMAAVVAGIDRKTFLLACEFEYDFFDKKKKVKKSLKKNR